MEQAARLTPAFAGLVAYALVALLVGACGGGEDSPAVYTATVDPPYEKPYETLTDTSGKPFNIRQQTEGYLTLLYLGYTHCPDICPTQMADLAEALKSLGAGVRRQTRVIFITVDPERDTAEVMRDWLNLFDASFVGLRAEPQTLARLLNGFSMEYPKRTDLEEGYYTVSHAAFIIAFTRDNMGHVVFPAGMPVKDLKDEIPHLLKEDWK